MAAFCASRFDFFWKPCPSSWASMYHASAPFARMAFSIWLASVAGTRGSFAPWMTSMGRLLADQGLVVERMEWMRDSPFPGHQLLVLTDEAPQGMVDLALHALQALPEVAGPCVQWRVEPLQG